VSAFVGGIEGALSAPVRLTTSRIAAMTLRARAANRCAGAAPRGEAAAASDPSLAPSHRIPPSV
jgi:hypothetical protein